MIKVVLFDVGGVLISSTVSATSKALKDLGLTEVQVEDVWKKYINTKLGCGLISEQQFWQAVCTDYGLRQVTVEENLLGKPYAKTIKPHDEVLAIARSLKQRGLTLAILSDTIEPHAKVMRDLNIFDGFDKVFLSNEIGCRKPKAKTFRYVIDQLNVQPGEVVFIDDREVNTQGAEAIGMHGILFRDDGDLAKEINRFLI